MHAPNRVSFPTHALHWLWCLSLGASLLLTTPTPPMIAADGTPAPHRPANPLPGEKPVPANTPASPAGQPDTQPAPTDPPKAPPESAAKRPVILLTGYEPFGGADINPSWEMIKDFDGRQWHEYTLVARKLPVIWGAPLPTLKQYLEELKPVAVFSFGQGKPDRFYIETLARNDRGPFEDNDGKKPAKAKIADGPAEYRVAELTQTIQAALAKQGYPIVQSKDAGKYLCEECLYSLLHLQATAFKKTYVQFCHVPAFGNQVGPPKMTIDAASLKKFVADTLETWRTHQNPPPQNAPDNPR